MVKTIKKLCKEENVKFKIIVTKYPHHATEISKKYANEPNVAIFSVGGDGTLNEVINGMIGSKNPVCMIPAGSRQ